MHIIPLKKMMIQWYCLWLKISFRVTWCPLSKTIAISYSERLFEGRKDVSPLTKASFHRPHHQVHASINNANWPTRSMPPFTLLWTKTKANERERRKNRSPETSGWRHRTRTLPTIPPNFRGSPIPEKYKLMV